MTRVVSHHACHMQDLCVDGYLSKEHIAQHYPAMKAAFEGGMEWAVIRDGVTAHVPELTKLLAEAGNKPHGGQRVDTSIQQLLRLRADGLTNKKQKLSKYFCTSSKNIYTCMLSHVEPV